VKISFVIKFICFVNSSQAITAYIPNLWFVKEIGMDISFTSPAVRDECSAIGASDNLIHHCTADAANVRERHF
jgi:hypothetical protein